MNERHCVVGFVKTLANRFRIKKGGISLITGVSIGSLIGAGGCILGILPFFCLFAPLLGGLAGFILGFCFSHVDMISLALEVDGKLDDHDLIASAYCFIKNNIDNPDARQTIIMASKQVSKAQHEWPKVRLELKSVLAMGVCVAFLLVSYVSIDMRKDATIDGTFSENTSKTDGFQLSPLKVMALEVSDKIIAIAYDIENTEAREKALKLARSLKEFGSDKGSLFQVIADAREFATSSPNIDEKILASLSPEIISLLSTDPLTQGIAEALKKKDITLAKRLLQALLKNAHPEDLKRLADKFKGLRMNMKMNKEEDKMLSDAINQARVLGETEKVTDQARVSESPNKEDGKDVGIPKPLEEKVAYDLKKVKDISKSAPQILGREKIEVGYSRHPLDTKLTLQLKDIRFILPEDMASIQLPKTQRRMIEDYFDRLEAYENNR